MASSRVYSHVLGTPEIGSLNRTGQIKIPAAEQGGGAVAHFQLQFGQVFEVGGVVTSRIAASPPQAGCCSGEGIRTKICG